MPNLREKSLTNDYVIPHAFDNRVVQAVAHAVADAAVKTGVARKIDLEQDKVIVI